MKEKREYYSRAKASSEDDHNAFAWYLSDLWNALIFGRTHDRFEVSLRNAKRNKRALREAAQHGHPDHKETAREVLHLMAGYGFWGGVRKQIKRLLRGR